LRRDHRFRPKLERLEDREVPAVLQVNPANPLAFHTIQSAINAANQGDVIDVAHASYFEDVVINKGVSLIGQPDPVTHQNPFIVGSGGTAGSEVVVRVAPNVNGVLIQNFAIGDSEGQQAQQTGVEIDSGASNVVLNHDVIRKVRNPLAAFSGPTATTGILVQPAAHNISITNVAVYEIHDPPGSTGAVGIVVNGASQVSIAHTYVKNVGDTGFIIEGAASGVTLSNDAVEETESTAGVGFLVADSAQVNLNHDKAYALAGASTGLEVSDSANVVGTKDELSENGVGALVTADFTGSLSLTYGDINGNTQAGVINLSSVVVNATGDWWGDPSGPAPQGLGNKVQGSVNFAGWLTTPPVPPP
jgi:hypothetical protein